MKTSQDRILTTHVGSLPRPAELRRLLVAKDKFFDVGGFNERDFPVAFNDVRFWGKADIE